MHVRGREPLKELMALLVDGDWGVIQGRIPDLHEATIAKDRQGRYVVASNQRALAKHLLECCSFVTSALQSDARILRGFEASKDYAKEWYIPHLVLFSYLESGAVIPSYSPTHLDPPGDRWIDNHRMSNRTIGHEVTMTMRNSLYGCIPVLEGKVDGLAHPAKDATFNKIPYPASLIIPNLNNAISLYASRQDCEKLKCTLAILFAANHLRILAGFQDMAVATLEHFGMEWPTHTTSMTQFFDQLLRDSCIRCDVNACCTIPACKRQRTILPQVHCSRFLTMRNYCMHAPPMRNFCTYAPPM